MNGPSPPHASGTPCTGGNVVVFGQTGVGKSSIINMLLGESENRILTSSGANGCTFASENYVVDVGDGVSVRVHDTVGLGEGSAGTVSSTDAIVALYRLLRSLQEGVNLFLFVMRVGRIVQSDQNNYKLFYRGFCDSQVPIALILTHGEDCLDDEGDMDAERAMAQWWESNAPKFARSELHFRDKAIVIARRRVFPLEYETSKEKMRRLILTSHQSTAWKMDVSSWFITIVKRTWNFLSRFLPFGAAQLAPQLTRVLTTYGGMREKDAILLANDVASSPSDT